MKVSIDPKRCMAHGMCYGIAPGVFTEDDYGDGHVIGDGNIAPEAAADVRASVAACPQLAISLEDDER